MAINAKTFQDQFAIFKEWILRKSNQPFTSFREGLAADWEGYKLPLREKALSRLASSFWSQTSVGSGQILRRLISAIEIPEEGRPIPKSCPRR